MHFLLFSQFLLIFTQINHEKQVHGMLAQGSQQLLQRGFFMVKGKPIGTFLPKTMPKTVKPLPLPKQPIGQQPLANVGKKALTEAIMIERKPLITKIAKTALFERADRIWNMGKAKVQTVSKKMMFGLDEIGAEAVRVPAGLTRKVTDKMVSRMLKYTGEKCMWAFTNYNAAAAYRSLPKRAQKILATVAAIADIGHSFDEYWQVLFLSYVNPDQVGVGVPRGLEELGQGLNNFWWDAWPDFAFGVPRALVGMNPHALILQQAYTTLFEYVGKKLLAQGLKDYVWSSQVGPVRDLNEFTAKEVPIDRVFGADDKTQPEMNQTETGSESPNLTETGKVEAKQALLDSQKDSNLYKYFAVNSIRSLCVIAVAVQVNFFKLSKEVPIEELSDLAQQAKATMERNPEISEKMEKQMLENEDVQRILASHEDKAEMLADSAKDLTLDENATGKLREQLEQMDNSHLKHFMAELNTKSFLTDKTARDKLMGMKRKIDAFGYKMNAETDAAVKPELLRMGRRIAERMVCKNGNCFGTQNATKIEDDPFENMANTMAELISFASTKEGIDHMIVMGAQNAMAKENGQGRAMKSPKIFNGKIVLPQCSDWMREHYVALMEAKNDKNPIKNAENPTENQEDQKKPKFEPESYSLPFCDLKNEYSQILDQTGLKFDGIEFMHVPIYDEAEMSAIAKMFYTVRNAMHIKKAVRKFVEMKKANGKNAQIEEEGAENL